MLVDGMAPASARSPSAAEPTANCQPLLRSSGGGETPTLRAAADTAPITEVSHRIGVPYTAPVSTLQRGEGGAADAAEVVHSRSSSEVMFRMEDAQVDVALLARVATRDPAAIASLYDRHHRVLYSLIVRILRDRSEAEDVLQEVFVRAWTRVDTYDRDLGSPAAWLMRIARNRAIDRLRARDVRARSTEKVSLSERQRAVVRALDVLTADQRLLIEHAYFGGLSQSELAARFAIPLGTVKTRIRTGMMALRRELQHVDAAPSAAHQDGGA
jgi:RNA polymerase sigma-70 factor (ECF subfamily)